MHSSIFKTDRVMRKVLLFIVAVLLAACSATEKDKAERLIDEYFEKNANDPSSVEIIRISELRIDSVTSYLLTDDYREWMDAFDEDSRAAELYTDAGNMKEAETALKHMDAILKKVDEKEKDFKPYMTGYYVSLEYRAKNGFGALVKSSAIVRFDKDMTKITSFDAKE